MVAIDSCLQVVVTMTGVMDRRFFADVEGLKEHGILGSVYLMTTTVV